MFTMGDRLLGIVHRQFSAVTRQQLLGAGVPASTIDRMIADGRLVVVHHGVYRVREMEWTTAGRHMAACLATSGFLSHRSAGWWWRLLDRPPALPEVTVGYRVRNSRPGIIIHRSGRIAPRSHARLGEMPCTSAARTIADLAAAVGPAELEGALDRVLARRLVLLDDLVHEAEATRAFRARGGAALDATLRRRGLVGAPTPSVLESMVLRVLRGAGIVPRSCECRVEVDGRHYRIDVELADHIGLEVDGFVYHATPEARHRDQDRRNALCRAGWKLQIYNWTHVTRCPQQIVREVRELLADAA